MNRPRLRFRLLVWTVGLLLVAGAGIWAASYAMLKRTPEWYPPDTSTPDQRSKAAKAFEDILISIHNWGSKQRAAPARSHPRADATAVDPSTQQARAMLGQKPDEAVEISFTDDQLNAFFDKWANTRDRRAWFEQYVVGPRLVLRENQLILVGKIKEWDMVVSLVFEPRIDSSGALNMNLSHVLGGVLPMPDAMWSGQRRSIVNTLEAKLPMFQDGASISAEGIANGDAGSAAMNQLLLAMLRYKPASAVIFVPLDTKLSQNLPVKITSLAIHDHALAMTAERMSQDERETFLRQLKGDGQTDPAENPAP